MLMPNNVRVLTHRRFFHFFFPKFAGTEGKDPKAFEFKAKTVWNAWNWIGRCVVSYSFKCFEVTYQNFHHIYMICSDMYFSFGIVAYSVIIALLYCILTFPFCYLQSGDEVHLYHDPLYEMVLVLEMVFKLVKKFL